MSDQRSVSITKTIQQVGKNLLGFVRGRVKSLEDAEDVVQDVWYQFSKFSFVLKAFSIIN